MNASFALLNRVSQATVGIHSHVPQAHISNAIGLGTDRRGSGILVSPDGLILTVYYMILGAANVIVTLTNGDQHEARVVAQDYTTGLGLLKIEGKAYPFLEVISSESCQLGQEVFAVASVGGEKRCSDTGMITYLGPFEAVWEFILERSVCSTASSLVIGFNGGPLCDLRGRVVAVCYLNLAEVGRPILGIPGEYYLDARDELMRYGRRISVPPRMWLGVLSYTLQEHVVIAGVMPGSPGEKAGLRQGDLVLNVDGADVRGRRSLYEAVNRHQPGELVSLTIMRHNRVQQLEVAAIRVDDYLGS